MKKLLSIGYSPSAFNTAMLVLRLCGGILIAAHGYDKLVHFASYSEHFINFMGLSGKISLSLTIFAEVFCALLIILGLFTRVASVPIIIVMLVALFSAHNADFFGKGELATLFFLIFITLFLLGPGKVSIDGAMSK